MSPPCHRRAIAVRTPYGHHVTAVRSRRAWPPRDRRAGELGPSTIVGSAAYNLLIISAVCVMAIPAGQGRYIKDTGVFAITATFSVLAYVWLIFILQARPPPPPHHHHHHHRSCGPRRPACACAVHGMHVCLCSARRVHAMRMCVCICPAPRVPRPACVADA